MESNYMQLLELLFAVVQSLLGRDPDDDQRSFVDDAESLAQKFFFHGLSTLYLSRGTVLPDTSFRAEFGDFTSTIVLVRAMLETYLTFYHTYIEPKDDPPLMEFRHLARILSSLLQRQKYPTDSPEAAQQLAKDTAVIEKVRSELQTNARFLELDTKKQDDLLKKGTISGRHPPFESWIKIAKRSGFSPKHAQTVYSFLSIHAHSGYISTLQVRQTKTAKGQRELMEGALTVAVITTAKMIFSYCELFPKAGEALKEMPDAARLAEIYVGASQML